MAVEDNPSTNATEGLADLHKGPGVAVKSAQARWYIAECKPTKEGVVRNLLQHEKYEVYVASRLEEKIYANRTRHTKERIIIPGKVFVRTEKENLMKIMLGHSSVWRFMINRTSAERSYAFVPDHEMQQLQYVLGHAENPIHLTVESLKVNQKVKVMRGALAGLEGWYHQEGHSSYVVIKVTMGTNHYVYTEVLLEDIQMV